MLKKKILWVVYDFNQAGGQRYVYEICKALNKEKYEIHFLKLAPLNHDKNWNSEFYYQPTLNLGCKIFTVEELKKIPPSDDSVNKKLSPLKKVFNQRPFKINKNSGDKTRIKIFLSNYDYINFSGLNVYRSLCTATDSEYENGIIHILTARFQDKKNIYGDYNKELNYRFVSAFSNDTLKFELEDFKNYRHTYYPLAFETVPYKIPGIEKKDKKFVIAVFTRLSNMKPLDPYFYAIKLLLEKQVNVELRIYGAGDPAELGLIRQLNYLYITKNVSFPGHLESILAELTKNEIDLIWFQSNNQLPAGYAALEIAMSALPQVFWDFSDIGLKNPIGEIFPSFTSLTDFVDYSEKLLNCIELRKKLGDAQRGYVIKYNSSKSHIHILEELFDQ